VSHSHIPVRHFLQKLESQGRPDRDARPEWLLDLIDAVAEMFEPFAEVGRVGYDCNADRDRWNVMMYLGSTEFVGGRLDGTQQHVDFQFDILRLHALFTEIRRLEWNAFPGNSGREELDCSYVAIDGDYAGNAIRLRIFSTPPRTVGPGLRQKADGTCEPV